MQEHHVTEPKIGETQAAALDLGWRGVWSPAIATGATDGSVEGVAVLAPHGAQISQNQPIKRIAPNP